MTNRSGFDMKFRFQLDGGPDVEVNSGIADVLRFEKVQNRGFGSSDKISDLVWISWSAAVRQKLITEHIAKFDLFSDHLTFWEVVEGAGLPAEQGDAETGPTQPDQLPES